MPKKGCFSEFIGCLAPPARAPVARRVGVPSAAVFRPRVSPSGCKDKAGTWLRGNKNPSPFASNRFNSARAAQGVVDALYAAGATCVSVAGILKEPRRVAEEGGPYADALLVKGPKAKFAAFQKVGAQFQADENNVRGNAVRLWWD